MLAAGFFRLWQLGQLPPGLYRDEAFNGLDAIGVLGGRHPLFFAANNGREPAYIYLTAFFVSIFGHTALAVRLGAAVIGTLTTLLTYQLAKTWFGRLTGLLAAWLWAVTLWPVHMSRIGLRPIMMAPFLAAVFWLGTEAYRKRDNRLWALSGLVYGLSFYTYLAIRFTPFLLLILAGFLLWRGGRGRLWPGLLWFGAGAAAALAPFAVLVYGQPDVFLGRTAQVSILSPSINGGDLWGTLWRNISQALGLFLWQGDTILRHNPAGRPVFDLFMAVPFVAGLGCCLRRWRKPAAMALLLWLVVMLGPTILAEDTPHFLRASGLLPAVVVVPAIGLAQLWRFERVPIVWRQAAVIGLIAASGLKTAWDYQTYGRDPEVGYLFEAGAADLARQISAEPAGTKIFVDERFWSGWPSIPYLVQSDAVERYRPETGLIGMPSLPFVIYAWPYATLDYVPEALPDSVLVSAWDGSLARGDLEDTANPLFVRYAFAPRPETEDTLANFGNQLELERAVIEYPEANLLQVDLYWRATSLLQPGLAVFVHADDPDARAFQQDDGPVADGRWLIDWWQPGQLVQDRHLIKLWDSVDADRLQIVVGVYEVISGDRLPLLAENGQPAGDMLTIEQ